MQMRRRPPSGLGRMQACMRLSLDSRRGKLAGTTTLPCFVVTSIAPRLSVWPGLLSTLAMAGPGSISTFSTGAQSRPEQHSMGYQSCAEAGVAAASAAARSHFLDIVDPRFPFLRFPPGVRSRPSCTNGANTMPHLFCAWLPARLYEAAWRDCRAIRGDGRGAAAAFLQNRLGEMACISGVCLSDGVCCLEFRQTTPYTADGDKCIRNPLSRNPGYRSPGRRNVADRQMSSPPRSFSRERRVITHTDRDRRPRPAASLPASSLSAQAIRSNTRNP